MFAVRDVRGTLKGFCCNYLWRKKPDETKKSKRAEEYQDKLERRRDSTKLRPTRVLNRFAAPKFNLFNHMKGVYNPLSGSDEKKAKT
jgi:hypothetical protein